MAQLQELLRVFLERFQDGDNHDCAKQVQLQTRNYGHIRNRVMPADSLVRAERLNM